MNLTHSLITGLFGALVACNTAAPAIDQQVTEVTVISVVLGGMAGCDSTHRSITYTRATHTMNAPGCSGDAGSASYAEVTRQLSDDNAKKVEATLGAMTYTTPTKEVCTYDGHEYYMTTRTKEGRETKYSASNVNCPGYPVASSIRELYELLASQLSP